MQASVYFDEITHSLRKGVKFRILTDSLPNFHRIKEFSEFKHFFHYELKFLETAPLTLFSIYDKKEVLLLLLPTEPHGESDTLWSNNPSFVAITQERFETLWAQAKPSV